jgi:hypothetical protein
MRIRIMVCLFLKRAASGWLSLKDSSLPPGRGRESARSFAAEAERAVFFDFLTGIEVLLSGRELKQL